MTGYHRTGIFHMAWNFSWIHAVKNKYSQNNQCYTAHVQVCPPHGQCPQKFNPQIVSLIYCNCASTNKLWQQKFPVLWDTWKSCEVEALNLQAHTSVLVVVWASLSESRSSIIWWENVVRLTDWLTDCVCPSRVYITTHMTSYIQPHFQTSPVFYCLGFSFRIIITRKRKNGKKSNRVLYWTPVHMLGLLHRLTCQAVNRMPSQKAAEFSLKHHWSAER